MDTNNSVRFIFALLYGIMFSCHVLRAIQNPTQVYILLSLFCASELNTLHDR